MRKSIVLAAALGSMVFSGAAFATTPGAVSKDLNHNRDQSGVMRDMGVITALHADGHSITLSDGDTYVLPNGMHVKNFKKGEMVTVTYTPDGSFNNVTSVRAV